MLLPVDLKVSKRSHKFYDGTYIMVADGFTDEVGVYREFDCYDPAARAPTPLPPTFDEDLEDHCRDPVQPGVTLKRGVDSRVPSTICTESDSTAVLTDVLLLGHLDRARLCGKFAGIHLVSQQTGTKTSLADCHRKCGLPHPEEIHCTEQSTPSIVALTPVKQIKQTNQPTDSPLSACPSDISDWEEGKKTTSKKKTQRKVTQKMQDLPNEDVAPKAKKRGVAQKVRKTSKKAAPASKRNAVIPNVLSMQTTIEDSSGRRRSARQANTAR